MHLQGKLQQDIEFIWFNDMHPFISSEEGSLGEMMQVRRKGANENLAEWIVDITTEADRQGLDLFIDTYRQ
jgi:hypothetical protein